MSDLILPDSIKMQREIDSIEVSKYKGFLTTAIQIPNAYREREEMGKLLPSVLTDDAEWARYKNDKIWWAVGLNKELKIEFYAIGGDKNEAGRNLLKRIDVFLGAKYGKN